MVSIRDAADDAPSPIGSSSADAQAIAAPANCARRGRAEDAALGAEALVSIMRTMDSDVVSALVRARELAAGVSKSFPGGDERFGSVDSESDEEVEHEISDDEAAEPCQGLFDATMDPNAESCIQRAKTETGFDLRGEMNAVKMPFLVRVRIVNFIRSLVLDGHKADDVVRQAREAIADGEATVCTEDKWLVPVLPGDLLLTVLEDEDDESDVEEGDDKNGTDAVAETVRQVLG